MSPQTPPTETTLAAKIQQILAPYPDALEFTLAYNRYVHLVDDCVDEDWDIERFFETISLAADIFSSPFFIKHKSVLMVVEKIADNTCLDSVLWERSPEAWKQQAARTLRHAAIDMFFIVVHLVAGRKALREISLEFREHTFLKHLED